MKHICSAATNFIQTMFDLHRKQALNYNMQLAGQTRVLNYNSKLLMQNWRNTAALSKMYDAYCKPFVCIFLENQSTLVGHSRRLSTAKYYNQLLKAIMWPVYSAQYRVGQRNATSWS